MSNPQGYTALKTNRYERKFRVDTLPSQAIEKIVTLHPAYFNEVFEERYINNIYFDTPGFDFYHDNQMGKSNREKVRIRWYGVLTGKIHQPILEIKQKSGMTGTKRSFLLTPFELNEKSSESQLKDVFLSSDLPEDVLEKVKSLLPTLINRYQRKYFLDASAGFRVTIDREMSFHGILGRAVFPARMRRTQGTVVELKYDFELDTKASMVTNAFPFRLTKNSKYVNGVEMFRSIAL